MIPSPGPQLLASGEIGRPLMHARMKDVFEKNVKRD